MYYRLKTQCFSSFFSRYADAGPKNTIFQCFRRPFWFFGRKKIPEENFLETFGSYGWHSAANELISSFVQFLSRFTFNSTSLAV